jgi:hypothetical protein
VVEEVDGFVEEPEAGDADHGEQGNHESRCHGKKAAINTQVYQAYRECEPNCEAQQVASCK